MSEGLEQVSVEQDGRVLTGVGVTEESLRETMDRHTPEPEPSETPSDPKPQIARNDQGQFSKQTRGQRRFDQLTGEREAERRAREAVEKERDELRQQLEAAKRSSNPSGNVPATPNGSQLEPAAKEAVSTPKPAQSTDKFTFPSYDEYVAANPEADWDGWNDAKQDARTDWKLKTGQFVSAEEFDARLRQSIEADRASRTLQERFEQSIKRAKEAHPDFDAVVNRPEVMNAMWSKEKLHALQQLDDPAVVQYALAKDPATYERLRTIPDLVTFGIELAKLMTAVPVASPASTGPAGSVIPPQPYQPVGSGSKTTVPPSAELAKRGFDFDKSGYREKRAAERGVTRRP